MIPNEKPVELTQGKEIRFRGEDRSKAARREIRAGLRTLHRLEIMAVNIYRFQITNKRSELNRQLIHGLDIEIQHAQDFLVLLYEYGFKPAFWRGIFWLIGLAFGFSSRLRGERAILKMGVWVEKKAVEHYDELIESIDWDDESRAIVRKNQADEYHHIDMWQTLLRKMDEAAGE